MSNTPGPWEAIKWECDSETTVVARGVIVVAECSGHGRYASESVDDAHLIAAAPDLREALAGILLLEKELVAVRHPAGQLHEAIKKAEAAIRKAKREL